MDFVGTPITAKSSEWVGLLPERRPCTRAPAQYSSWERSLKETLLASNFPGKRPNELRAFSDPGHGSQAVPVRLARRRTYRSRGLHCFSSRSARGRRMMAPGRRDVSICFTTSSTFRRTVETLEIILPFKTRSNVLLVTSHSIGALKSPPASKRTRACMWDAAHCLISEKSILEIHLAAS